MPRYKLPIEVETDVLLMSRRRCCLCVGLLADFSVRKGQIAHLDGNPNNNSPDNVAFLCLEHHAEYDSSTRQAKGFTVAEIRHYRERLYAQLHAAARPGISADDVNERDQARADGLAFSAYSLRAQSAVLALMSGPTSFADINASIPPCDKSWTLQILQWLMAEGLLTLLLPKSDIYSLTARGRRMLEALPELALEEKAAAWREVWDPPEEKGNT